MLIRKYLNIKFLNALYFSVLISFFLNCRNEHIISIKNESNSMSGTLEKGRYYKFKKQSDYRRGDIVAVRYYDKEYSRDKTSIFRIAGIAGDSVVFIKGLPYVNSVIVDLPKTSKRIYLLKADLTSIPKAIEGLQILHQSADTFFLNLTFMEKEDLSSKFKLEEYYLDKTGWNPWGKFSDSINHDFFSSGFVPHKLTDLDSNKVLFTGDWTSFNKQSRLYFLIGDNVQETFDSRYIGLVPQVYIIGKLITPFSQN